MSIDTAELFLVAHDPAPLPPAEAALLGALPLYGADQRVREIDRSDEAACRGLERRGLVKVHRWKLDPLDMRPTMHAGRLP